MKHLSLTALALSGLVASPALADTYIASNWLAPVHILNEQPYQNLAKDLAADPDANLTFEVYSSGSLVPAKSTMQGIRDNVAQLGVVYPGYTPSELPVNNVLNDLVFTSDDALASALAYTEVGINNAAVQGEWGANGGIFLGGYSTPVYNFICMEPIRSPTDAKGKKIRTAGGAQTSWVESLGGVPVSVPIGDVYSGLSRGSIDCTMSDPTNLDKGNKFWEVAKSVTTLPMGVVMGATYVVNPDFWKGLSVEQRAALLDHMALGLARTQLVYAADVEAAFAGSRERGLEIIEPGAELSEALAAFQSDFVATLPQKSIDDRGIEDPSKLINAFLASQQAWKERLGGIDRTDAEAVAELIRSDIFGKLDLATFGM
ncbi:C4-dicarboxylate TRAP transporter substrate-binding protein [Lentibacter sp. XHP0401]|jgi:TRAP-type C4-dicarboxylate transport system substrate-binding protein|uniref:C4-dicarboxylate TRAP transporter substrate-binding protein n=1 Tax=Lentibacter sp. XHP0401 TaxID=2984334 RepID=UPI0021E99233|nr:C4-dicarboxylate TRAP transporter substrate-binding protein [Lentibacter sp. XHP0401]MCV2894304.1 C4-dicarboxylate TRAP transporter substrate-binding protein [Lentibacter sp. XHP0401]